MAVSDYCSLELHFQKRALPIFESVLGEKFWDHVEDESEQLMWVTMTHTNYGLTSAREELLKRGVPFFGRHDSGIEYGPAVFACDGKKHVDCDSDHSGMPAVANVHRHAPHLRWPKIKTAQTRVD